MAEAASAICATSPLRARQAAGAATMSKAAWDALVDVRRVLHRDKAALELMFAHFAGRSPANEPPGPAGRASRRAPLEVRLLKEPAMALAKDFCIAPGLVSKKLCAQIYGEVAGDNAPTAAGAPLDAAAAKRGASFDSVYVTHADHGLDLDQFVDWLACVALECEWFSQSRGYETPASKAHGLLQWMDISVGKKNLFRKSGKVVPRLSAEGGSPVSAAHRERRHMAGGGEVDHLR